MRAKAGSRRLSEVHSVRVKKRKALRTVSMLINAYEDYLSEQLVHERGLRALDVLETGEASGNPCPTETFVEAFDSLDLNPAAVLAYSRECQNIPRDAFLAKILPRLAALAGRRFSSAAWPSRREEIRRLDLLRRSERWQAKIQLQRIVMADLENLREGSVPRQALIELCGLLGVLAAIYRLAGRRDDATDLLEALYPLVLETRDFRSRALWYQKVAYLLVDLHRLARADQFIKRAHFYFDLAGSEAERIRAMVDNAYVLSQGGHHQESREILENLLPRIPIDDSEYRLSAHQTLGKNHLALGDLAGAASKFDAAIALADGDVLGQAHCLWSRGKLQMELGSTARGLEFFAEALPLHAKVSGAGELAELSMEYADLLRREGRRPELRALAADLSGWLAQLKANLKLRAEIEEFQARLELGDLDDAAFQDVLARIRVAKVPDRRRKRNGRE